MKELLYLVHRIPYPPNKGDKIRSYHLLKHLASRYRVHLGTFIDDERDCAYVEQVRKMCMDSCFVRIRPLQRRIASLAGFVSGEALCLPYYRHRALGAWIEQVMRTRPISRVVVFSSTMAQYLPRSSRASRLVDFVDVDSDKWMQYAGGKRWPLSWLYARESRLLLAYERQVAASVDRVTFVSDAEAALFRTLAPEARDRIGYFNNGVDADYFSPHVLHADPYPAGTTALVFTGAMDYWANEDAVTWFAHHVFGTLRQRLPGLSFYIVGARPTPGVRALAALPGIVVTGSVADVRPYLAHAALAVAPLRIARGVQNKVLEAMAMEKAVVASGQAVQGISAEAGRELVVAHDEHEYVQRILELLHDGRPAVIGRAARTRVLERYSWAGGMHVLDRLIETADSATTAEQTTASLLPRHITETARHE